MRMLAVVSVAISLIAISCNSSDPSTADGNVTVESGINNPTVSSFEKSGDRPQGGTFVSSLRVARVRVLVSRMKLHSDGKPDSSDDKTFKLEPFVYVADSTGSRVVATVPMPNGNYDKIKWEIHRFSSSEVPNYLNDTTFRDFVTGARYTVLIEGSLVRDGITWPFVYRSDVTSNITIKFSPAITVSNNSPLFLSLKFDAPSVFKAGSNILDPEDSSNRSEIENRIKAAFRANKK
ncbi:MAG: hypothetical protein H7X70_01145 [Candidatus Kapabacteria bacterium]|nr:hypothetical protein [Candidatus Kapabacteria bacterium]